MSAATSRAIVVQTVAKRQLDFQQRAEILYRTREYSLDERGDEIVLALKVPIQRALAEVGFLDDIVHP